MLPDFHKLAADKPATPTSDAHCEYDHEPLASSTSDEPSFELSTVGPRSPRINRSIDERPALIPNIEGNREKNESSAFVSVVETVDWRLR